jgi:glycosyltransferase involved in cell wall biosynthesis
MHRTITVFIPVKNGADFLEETIRSVQTQTFQDWRLVIKDNCSTDNTPLIVQKYLDDPRIVFESRDSDIGSLGNYNSCLDDISSPYYLILSHDDYLHDSRALEKAYVVMEQHPDVVKVHCDMLFVDEHSAPIVPRRFRRQGCLSSDDVAKKSILMTRNLYGIPLLVRSNIVGQIRYDQELYHTADIDFSIAVGRGKKIFHIPEVLIALRIHRNNTTHRRYNTISDELKISARNNGIILSPLDHVVMLLSDVLQRIQKCIFFKYLSFR